MKNSRKKPKSKTKSKIKSHTIEIDFLGGDRIAKLTNELMHATDTFENGKQFAIHSRFVVTGNPNLNTLCKHIADAHNKAGGYAVFVGIRKIDGKRVNDGKTWFMNGVQSLSMKQGDQPLSWGMFKDVLVQLDYAVKTDAHMRVIEVV